MERNEAEMVLNGLRKQPKEIPVTLLYDKQGSEIYEEITLLKEYYLFNAEFQLFKENALDIAETIIPGSVLVELGCGTARKTACLLKAVIEHQGRCSYVGIDVSEVALKEAETNLRVLVPGLKPSAIDLVQADFVDGLKQVKHRYPDDMLCIVWLGSSVGNLSHEDTVDFFKHVVHTLGSNCQLLVCMDMWKNPEILRSAYHDKQGATERFIKHGMQNALGCIGYPIAEDSVNSWAYEVEINKALRRVEMYVNFAQGLNLPEHEIEIRPGEKVLVEFSTKFTAEDIKNIATKACFQVYASWGNDSYYTCQMLLPGRQALVQCWNETDMFFGGISNWSAKPIELRHPYLFYYGHVCAFGKLKITGQDEASHFDYMFSRGINPNVMDPSQCHSHPPVPSEWPSKNVVVDYVRKNRVVVDKEVAKGKLSARTLCFVMEHERMHQETLAYMLTQDKKALFEKKTLASTAYTQNGQISDLLVHNVPQPQVFIKAGEVVLGVDSDESFVWDNESPAFHTKVSQPFMVSAKPVSIKDFLCFMIQGGYKRPHLWTDEDFAFVSKSGFVCPATWSAVGNEYYIHSYGSTKHWTEVAEEAVYVSLAEAEAFCKWMECRVMTEAEYQRILDYDCQGKVQKMRVGGWEWTSTQFHPFPGFKPMAEYREYSTDFFDGRHYVLKGSSPVTHSCMRRDSFRNFYQRQYPFVFSKFRCCRSLP